MFLCREIDILALVKTITKRDFLCLFIVYLRITGKTKKRGKQKYEIVSHIILYIETKNGLNVYMCVVVVFVGHTSLKLSKTLWFNTILSSLFVHENLLFRNVLCLTFFLSLFLFIDVKSISLSLSLCCKFISVLYVFDNFPPFLLFFFVNFCCCWELRYAFWLEVVKNIRHTIFRIFSVNFCLRVSLVITDKKFNFTLRREKKWNPAHHQKPK